MRSRQQMPADFRPGNAQPKPMKTTLLLLGLVCSAPRTSAVAPPADAKTFEGWQVFGFPIDDFVPWNPGL